MAATIPTRLRLTEADQAALVEYWSFFEPHAPAIFRELDAVMLEMPEWAPIVRSTPAHLRAQQEARSMELQRAAVVDGAWAPYLEDLRTQGTTYANMGISFVSWYEVITAFRELVRRRLHELAQTDMARASRYSDAFNRALDIVLVNVADTYIHTKESIIARQQAAIRELSLPVLQVRQHMLVIPLVGILDTQRARQLLENLLAAIRDRRAQAVVIDVTGVPVIDTNVANHLVQAVEAARLMGATVAITGMSPEIAQTLVALGATLPAIETHIDLQEGIEQIERSLAVR